MIYHQFHLTSKNEQVGTLFDLRNLIKKNVKQQKLMTVLRRCSTVYLKFGKIADGVCGRISLLVNVQANLAQPKMFSGEFSK